MSEAVSALKGASRDGFVRVEECGLQGMVTLRGDLGAAKLATAVKSVAGVALPKPGRVSVSGDKGVAWMSPDELLVMAPYDQADAVQAGLETALAGAHMLAVNVSDARAMFRLSGSDAGVREAIAKLCPVDMDPQSFGVGQFRRTRMAQSPAALWMPDEGELRVVCFRSVADYAMGLLGHAAAKGSEVGLFS